MTRCFGNSEVSSAAKIFACRHVKPCQRKQAGKLFVWFPTQHTLNILGLHVMDRCFQSTQAAYYQQGNTRAIEDIENAGFTPCHLNLLRSLQIQANLVVDNCQLSTLN